MESQLRDREQLRGKTRDREQIRKDELIVHKERYHHHFKSISWSAIFTGALVGIGISFIFNLFAMAIGLTAFVSTTTNAKTIAIGGLISLVLITIFSMGTAGWVAGYLGRPRSLHRDMGVIYGFTTWCVALVLAVLLSASFGKFITYNIAALQYPGYVLTNVDTTNPIVTNTITTNTIATNTQQPTTNPNLVNTQNANKAWLALTTFLLFALAFIGALSSSIGGHWGFRSAEKDILYYRDREGGQGSGWGG